MWKSLRIIEGYRWTHYLRSQQVKLFPISINLLIKYHTSADDSRNDIFNILTLYKIILFQHHYKEDFNKQQNMQDTLSSGCLQSPSG